MLHVLAPFSDLQNKMIAAKRVFYVENLYLLNMGSKYLKTSL